MGIDVGSANARANDLRGCANDLRSAKSNLAQYKAVFGSDWQATEAGYFASAVGGVENRMNQAISELESIAGDIVSTANAIRKEEEEKARREAEERARREAEERARREEQERREAEERADKEKEALAVAQSVVRSIFRGTGRRR